MVKNPSLRPSSLAAAARSDRASNQVLAMVLLSGFGNRMKGYETSIFDLRTAVRMEQVMVRDSFAESIVGTVNHHGMKKATATSTLEVAVKRHGTRAEATVLCEDCAKQLGTIAGVEARKDWVQALCTLAVGMLHDTCCCELSEEPAARSRALA